MFIESISPIISMSRATFIVNYMSYLICHDKYDHAGRLFIQLSDDEKKVVYKNMSSLCKKSAIEYKNKQNEDLRQFNKISQDNNYDISITFNEYLNMVGVFNGFVKIISIAIAACIVFSLLGVISIPVFDVKSLAVAGVVALEIIAIVIYFFRKIRFMKMAFMFKSIASIEDVLNKSQKNHPNLLDDFFDFHTARIESRSSQKIALWFYDLSNNNTLAKEVKLSQYLSDLCKKLFTFKDQKNVSSGDWLALFSEVKNYFSNNSSKDFKWIDGESFTCPSHHFYSTRYIGAIYNSIENLCQSDKSDQKKFRDKVKEELMPGYLEIFNRTINDPGVNNLHLAKIINQSVYPETTCILIYQELLNSIKSGAFKFENIFDHASTSSNAKSAISLIPNIFSSINNFGRVFEQDLYRLAKISPVDTPEIDSVFKNTVKKIKSMPFANRNSNERAVFVLDNQFGDIQQLFNEMKSKIPLEALEKSLSML